MKILFIFLTLFLFKTTVDKTIFGNYHGEYGYALVDLTLKSDSTFIIDFSTQPQGYKTCGTFSVAQDTLCLKDFQDPKALLYDIDCSCMKKTWIGLDVKTNIWTIFNEQGLLKLKINRNSLYWIKNGFGFTLSKKK